MSIDVTRATVCQQVVGLIRADGRGGFRRARVIWVEGGCRRGAGKNAAHVNTRKVLLRATFCGLDGSDYGICKLGSVNWKGRKNDGSEFATNAVDSLNRFLHCPFGLLTRPYTVNECRIHLRVGLRFVGPHLRQSPLSSSWSKPASPLSRTPFSSSALGVSHG